MFTITVIKNEHEEEIEEWEKEVEESESLDAEIQYVHNDGKVRIKFNEDLVKHFNYTKLHLREPPVLKFKLWSESEK